MTAAASAGRPSGNNNNEHDVRHRHAHSTSRSGITKRNTNLRSATSRAVLEFATHKHFAGPAVTRRGVRGSHERQLVPKRWHNGCEFVQASILERKGAHAMWTVAAHTAVATGCGTCFWASQAPERRCWRGVGTCRGTINLTAGHGGATTAVVLLHGHVFQSGVTWSRPVAWRSRPACV